jgi:hypothetical protein
MKIGDEGKRPHNLEVWPISPSGNGVMNVPARLLLKWRATTTGVLPTICARGVTYPAAIESVHVDAYIEQLHKSRASPQGARHSIVPKSTPVDRQLAGAGDSQRANAPPPRSIQRLTRVQGTPSPQLGMADELLAAWQCAARDRCCTTRCSGDCIGQHIARCQPLPPFCRRLSW